VTAGDRDPEHRRTGIRRTALVLVLIVFGLYVGVILIMGTR